MLTLLLVRHGNTFDKGDVVRRVGARTDIPLSQSGRKQCQELGKYLSKQYPNVEHAFCSELMRTTQSAQLILEQLNTSLCKITPLSLLNEVDYGEDDGKPETDVIKRIGIEAIKSWDENSILPKGWIFDSEHTIQAIKTFVSELAATYDNKTLLIVTSNGIARFFSHLLKDQKSIETAQPLKMPTASFSELAYCQKQGWRCLSWGKRF